jgi:hypothetical protein
MEAKNRMDNSEKRLENIFTYHPPKDGQPIRYEAIRREGREFALTVVDLCPDSPEKDEAIKKIQEAVFWANAAIARHE